MDTVPSLLARAGRSFFLLFLVLPPFPISLATPVRSLPTEPYLMFNKDDWRRCPQAKKNLHTGLHCSSVIKFQSQVACLDFLPSSVLLLPPPSDYNEDRGVCFSLETRTTVGNREFRGGKNSKKTDPGALLSAPRNFNFPFHSQSPKGAHAPSESRQRRFAEPPMKGRISRR